MTKKKKFKVKVKGPCKGRGRNIYFTDDDYEEVKRIANKRGESISAMILTAVKKLSTV